MFWVGGRYHKMVGVGVAVGGGWSCSCVGGKVWSGEGINKHGLAPIGLSHNHSQSG